jgi:hypothetical protein
MSANLLFVNTLSCKKKQAVVGMPMEILREKKIIFVYEVSFSPHLLPAFLRVGVRAT